MCTHTSDIKRLGFYQPWREEVKRLSQLRKKCNVPNMNTASAHLQSKFVHVLTGATSNQPEGEMQIVRSPSRFNQVQVKFTKKKKIKQIFPPSNLQFNYKTYTAKLVFFYRI